MKLFHFSSKTSLIYLKGSWLFPILFGLFLFTSCDYENVEVKNIKNVKIHQLDKDGISFTASLEVANPNGYKIKITSTDADLFLEGKKAGKAVLEEKIVIPGNFDGLVEAKVRANFEGGSLQLLPVIMSSAISQKAELRAKGYIKAKSFVIGQNFDFDYSHQAKF
ncbi:MAG: LEA type 2 family protein [Flavobacteriales bacterium]|nr:LEA type 2 family protein [Flavobacteriales bacterium]